ncbi:helix-turn-helix domain-containing protein [Actinoplanes sp. NPDC049316]|uniref:PucR family transcriptional regulator n=1 Tax=Actinoplanes sp. NPDC049316 TaxID=3154727 RepID=UPI003446F312
MTSVSERAATTEGWLPEACAGLLTGPGGSVRVRAAAALGARVADAGLQLRELVEAVMMASIGHWASAAPAATDVPDAVHGRAAALLTTARETLAAAVDGYNHRARGELDRRDSARAAFVTDLLTGRADPGDLAERAHRYGIRLSAAHTVLVARAPGLTVEAARRVDAALAARFGEGNTLTTLRGDDLVCISAGGLRGISGELSRLLLAEMGTAGWQLAVGRTHRGLQGLAASLDEARGALDHAVKLGFTAPVLYAADLLVFPVLLRDREAIMDLVTTVLGPLTGARGGAGPYLDTLTAFFDSQGNHTATARRMHLSVRAVTYRLDRIRDLTGYHPGEPTQRFTLQAAVLGARLLSWPG